MFRTLTSAIRTTDETNYSLFSKQLSSRLECEAQISSNLTDYSVFLVLCAASVYCNFRSHGQHSTEQHHRRADHEGESTRDIILLVKCDLKVYSIIALYCSHTRRQLLLAYTLTKPTY